MTRNEEFLFYVAAMTACQVWTVIRFAGLLRRREPQSYAPPASVIVPCKGDIPGLEGNARALLAQDYPRAEILFVTPSETDASVGPLRRAGGKVLTSGGVPKVCSGKIVDMLHALERADPSSEVLVFCDADLRVGPGWLRSMVAPLADERTAVATSCALYVAAGGGFWTFLRMVWMGTIIPYAALTGAVIGHSMALRRSTYEAMGVGAIWSRSLLEDVSLSQAARAAGKRVSFVGAAMSASTEECDRAFFFALTMKWVQLMRVYDPHFWVACFGAVFLQSWIVFWCLRRPMAPAIPALMLAGDCLAIGLAFAVYRRYRPDLFAELGRRWEPLAFWAAAAAPAVWLCCAVQLLGSAFASRIRWCGRTYLVRGPQDVEVVG